jgi:hypothetical protein
MYKLRTIRTRKLLRWVKAGKETKQKESNVADTSTNAPERDRKKEMPNGLRFSYMPAIYAAYAKAAVVGISVKR